MQGFPFLKIKAQRFSRASGPLKESGSRISPSLLRSSSSFVGIPSSDLGCIRSANELTTLKVKHGLKSWCKFSPDNYWVRVLNKYLKGVGGLRILIGGKPPQVSILNLSSAITSQCHWLWEAISKLQSPGSDLSERHTPLTLGVATFLGEHEIKR